MWGGISIFMSSKFVYLLFCISGQECECDFSTIGQQKDHQKNSQTCSQGISSKDCSSWREGSGEGSPERREGLLCHCWRYQPHRRRLPPPYHVRGQKYSLSLCTQ